MSSEEYGSDVNYVGELCPYPVVKILEHVENMKPGDKFRFCVDDPLAVKSIPDELEAFDDIRHEIVRKEVFWEVIIERAPYAKEEK